MYANTALDKNDAKNGKSRPLAAPRVSRIGDTRNDRESNGGNVAVGLIAVRSREIPYGVPFCIGSCELTVLVFALLD